jgi:Zn-dependent protease/CBS domain-containing protein
MFGRRFTLFRLFGFEVRLDATWLVIAALITWSLATAVFPAGYPYLTIATYWWMGVVGAILFFGSIVAHELCHSLVARHYDLPMTGITLFIFGGVAEMGGEPQSPKVEFLMAIAGPIASILLGAVFYGIRTAFTNGPIEAVAIFEYLAWINWILAAFNLIPAFPLDGGRVLRATLWHFQRDVVRSTRVAALVGEGFAFLLMIYGVSQLLFGSVISAVWYFLIGMFLRGASKSSYQQVLVHSALAGEPVSRLMRPNPVTVGPELSLQQLVDDYLYRYDFQVFPVVTESEELVGCVTAADVRAIPQDEWGQHRVSEVARPCSEANTVTPDTDILQALSKIRTSGMRRLMVTHRNHLLAIISVRDILNFMSAKMELERHSHGLA